VLRLLCSRQDWGLARRRKREEVEGGRGRKEEKKEEGGESKKEGKDEGGSTMATKINLSMTLARAFGVVRNNTSEAIQAVV
jgi:hypothetical protein